MATPTTTARQAMVMETDRSVDRLPAPDWLRRLIELGSWSEEHQPAPAIQSAPRHTRIAMNARAPTSATAAASRRHRRRQREPAAEHEPHAAAGVADRRGTGQHAIRRRSVEAHGERVAGALVRPWSGDPVMPHGRLGSADRRPTVHPNARRGARRRTTSGTGASRTLVLRG